jgi:hypothetical protein
MRNNDWPWDQSGQNTTGAPNANRGSQHGLVPSTTRSPGSSTSTLDHWVQQAAQTEDLEEARQELFRNLPYDVALAIYSLEVVTNRENSSVNIEMNNANGSVSQTPIGSDPVTTYWDELEEEALDILSRPAYQGAAELLYKFLKASGRYKSVSDPVINEEEGTATIKTVLELEAGSTLEQTIVLSEDMSSQTLHNILAAHGMPHHKRIFMDVEFEWKWDSALEYVQKLLYAADTRLSRNEGPVAAYANFVANLAIAPYNTVQGWFTDKHLLTGEDIQAWEHALGILDVIPGEAMVKLGVSALIVKIGNNLVDASKLAPATRAMMAAAKTSTVFKVSVNAANEVVILAQNGVDQVAKFSERILTNINWKTSGSVVATIDNVAYKQANGTTVFGSLDIVDDAGAVGFKVRGAAQALDATYDTQKSVIAANKGTIATASSNAKGAFGEIASDAHLSERGFTALHTRKTALSQGAGQIGIDGIFVKDGQYFIVEAKFHGQAKLGKLTDGTRQMSDVWVQSDDRILNAVQGNASLAQDIASNYTRILAEVAPDGSVTYFLLGGTGTNVSKLDIFIP